MLPIVFSLLYIADRSAYGLSCCTDVNIYGKFLECRIKIPKIEAYICTFFFILRNIRVYFFSRRYRANAASA